MFSAEGARRAIQERIRCGFGGRLSQSVVHMEDPYSYGWEQDDHFSPILISQKSSATVCSGITMDEALLVSSSSVDEQRTEEPFNIQADQTYPLDMAFAHEAMTMPHNIQNESANPSSVRHLVPDEEGNDRRAESSSLVKPVRTESTVLSSMEEEEEDALGLWNAPSDEQDGLAQGTSQDSKSMDRELEPKRNVSVTLEDFDYDHLTIYEHSLFGETEEDSCDNETKLIKKLERNASELYWLQLSDKIADARSLAAAMQGNTAVRNVTVYPAALLSLSKIDQKLVVDAICQLESLQNLIVFKDCGNLFIEPLIRSRPPLKRLTLYKASLAGGTLLSRLAVLMLGLPQLEELSLEKYTGTDGTKLLNLFAKVLPSLQNLRSLTLTPAKGVRMSNDGPKGLFRALWGNNTLQKLSLQGSEDNVDEGCIDELHQSLTANIKLEDVKLTGFWRSEEDFWGRFNQKTTAQIHYYLRLNEAGIRSLQLDVSADYETLKNALVHHRDNLDYIYYLLLHNPSMLDQKLSV